MCNLRRKREKEKKKTGNKGRRGELKRLKSKERKKEGGGSVARYVRAEPNHFLVSSSNINVSEDVG